MPLRLPVIKEINFIMRVTRHTSSRVVTWAVLAAFFALTSVAHPVPAVAQVPGAQLTTTGAGTVRIDGAIAATGATLFSGSRITTSSGISAVVAANGSRVTINPDTDAVVTFAGGFMRADVLCGSASGAPAAGTAFEMITQGGTSVYVQSGTVQVLADGRTTDLIANQTQTFDGGVRITTTGGAVVDASSILCSCMCAVPVAFPVAPVAGGAPIGLILALIAGGAAAAIIPIAIDEDDDDITPISPIVP